MKPTDKDNINYTISLRDVTKSFHRTGRQRSYSTIKSALLSLFSKKKHSEADETVALKSLTMRVPEGSSVGVIGRNGSGKSTLLKLITGIYKPTLGEIFCSGRVSALIELGAGFHPDFTGRENVFLGGMIQGLTKKQIQERFDQIVEFAELENFIDEPVRTYSSGMFMRLGFSLAIHSDPEVLLIDEVLAVGDEGFISKCKDKISSLRSEGVTLMLVTHDLAAVERWCDEAIWLDSGEVKDRGEPRRVIDAYRQFIEDLEEKRLEEQSACSPEAVEKVQSDFEEPSEREDESTELGVRDQPFERWGSREIQIDSTSIVNDSGEEHFVYHPNDSVTVRIQYSVRENVPGELIFGVGIHHIDGTHIFGTNTDIERAGIKVNASSPKGEVVCTIPRLSLLSGEYWLDVAVHREDGYPYDYWKHCLKFAVRSAEAQVGRVYLETQWESVQQASPKRSVA